MDDMMRVPSEEANNRAHSSGTAQGPPPDPSLARSAAGSASKSPRWLCEVRRWSGVRPTRPNDDVLVFWGGLRYLGARVHVVWSITRASCWCTVLLRSARTCSVGGRVASPLMARPPVHSHVRVQGSSTTVSYSWCSQCVIAVPKQAFASAEKGAVASWQLPVSVLHRQPGDPALAGAGGTKMPECHV